MLREMRVLLLAWNIRNITNYELEDLRMFVAFQHNIIS